uniref:DUF4367 domain-containing protein n=1 Tax=Candidatus Methanophaga sp. ANME-1 ERB7 TaxID=2759913 RepID=A0A7G9Z4N9_9EURY|nr:hypothetical protein MHJDHPNH_00025 [Methanosarcinales archaeon ANME-1 ERB7]
MNRTKKISLIIVALVLVTVAASTYFGYITFSATSPPEETSAAAEIAPDVLLGMDKMVVSTGVGALQRVKQSHAGNIAHVKDVAIVHYVKEDGMLTLWTTLYKNETIANTENEKMVIGMQNWGGGWASNLKERTIAGKQVYQTAPDNGSHYFWADREWVFYIIPHNFTHQEISQIIGAIP